MATCNLNQENKQSVKDNTERTKISQANDFDTSKNSESSGGLTLTQNDTTLLETPPSTQNVIKERQINQEKGENIRHGIDNSTQRTENNQTNDYYDTSKNEKIFGGFGSFTQSQCFTTEETPHIEFPLTQNVIKELQINNEKQTKDQKNTYYTKKELLKILDDDNQSLTSHNNSSKSSKLFNTQSSNITASNSNQLSVKDNMKNDQTNVYENSKLLTQDFGGFGTFSQSQSNSNVETPAIENLSTQNLVNEFEMNKKQLEKQNDENGTNMNEIINESHSMDNTSVDFIIYPI